MRDVERSCCEKIINGSTFPFLRSRAFGIPLNTSEKMVTVTESLNGELKIFTISEPVIEETLDEKNSRRTRQRR
jgi:hypothetical protein